LAIIESPIGDTHNSPSVKKNILMIIQAMDIGKPLLFIRFCEAKVIIIKPIPANNIPKVNFPMEEKYIFFFSKNIQI
ncbi:hypothetical protein E2Z16_08935, partial [Campylobacter jejuni]|nr:hypothetical protein [Campylobacter jejuni]